jgi:hypothetical protein
MNDEPLDLSTLTPEPDGPANFTRPNHRIPDEPRGLAAGFRKPRTGGPKLPPEPKPTPPYREGMFVKPMEEMYGILAMVAMPFNRGIGMTIAQQAHDCAEAWDYAAKESPAVRRVLNSVVQASVFGKLAAAHAPILMALAAQTERGQAFMGRMFADRTEEDLREATPES